MSPDSPLRTSDNLSSTMLPTGSLSRLRLITLALLALTFYLPTVQAQAEKVSLAEVAPPVIQQALRNRKFFGDPLTVNGNLFARSYVTGDWGGARTSLKDHGIYTYASVTQFLEGNLGGGNATKTRANGSADYGIWLDSGKANLWDGGGIFIHGETAWAQSINGDVGTIVPANMDATAPDPNKPSTALSEFYLIQAVGEKLTIGSGKMDLAAWADTSLWANNWRTQFQATALVNNPQLGAVVPYTTYATFFGFKMSDTVSVTYTINTQDGNATNAGFDTIFNGDMVNSLLFSYNSKTRSGLPVSIGCLVGYAAGEQADFAIDQRHAAQEILGLIPIQQTDGNWGVFLSGSRYLKMWDSGHEEGCAEAPSRPLGMGFFWRYGATPEDRNVISQFASAGLGGYGGLGNRIYDNWGIGWAGSYISPDLRNALSGIENVSVWEHTTEIFYNFRLSGNTNLTINAQTNDPALQDLETAYSIGSRMQVAF